MLTTFHYMLKHVWRALNILACPISAIWVCLFVCLSTVSNKKNIYLTDVVAVRKGPKPNRKEILELKGYDLTVMTHCE